MANQYSITAGGGMQSSSIDHSRRMYNFGEKVSELAPKQSPFFSYLSKVAKKPTDDPVFIFTFQYIFTFCLYYPFCSLFPAGAARRRCPPTLRAGAPRRR